MITFSHDFSIKTPLVNRTAPQKAKKYAKNPLLENYYGLGTNGIDGSHL
jgi:hypothetical protein